MHDILEFAGNYWWLVFVVGGVGGGWAARVRRYNERRRRYKIELARAKSGAQVEQMRVGQANTAAVTKSMKRHDDINERWFGYETDLATLIDYPLMIDMREPLTLAFHRAKVRADDLRPAGAADVTDPEEVAEYRDAVQDYVASFEAAEREARRRKQSDFSPVERDRLERARRLVMVAVDSAATSAERQAAYRRARIELDGLIDVPPVAAAQVEHRIAAAIERGPSA